MSRRPGRFPGVKRWGLRLGCAGLGLGVAALVLLGATGVWLRSESGNDAIRSAGVGLVNGQLDGTVSVEHLSTDLWSEAVLTGVSIDRDANHPLFRADSVHVALDPWALWSGPITAVDVEGFELFVDVAADGSVPWLELGAGALFEELTWLGIDAPLTARGRMPIRMPDGAGPVSGIEDVKLTARLAVDADGLHFRESALVGRLADPDTTSWPVVASGDLTFAGDQVTVDGPFELDGPVTIRGTNAGSLDADGLDLTSDSLVEIPGLSPLTVATHLSGPLDAVLAEQSVDTAGVLTAQTRFDLVTGRWTSVVTIIDFTPPVDTALEAQATGMCRGSGELPEGLDGTSAALDCTWTAYLGELPAQVQGPVEVQLVDGALAARSTLSVDVLGGTFDLEAAGDLDGVQGTFAGTVPLSALGVSGRGDVAVSGRFDGPPADLAVGGDLSGAALRVYDSRIARLDGSFTGSARDGELDVRAPVVLGELDAWGLTADRAEIAIRARFDGRHATGTSSFATVGIEGWDARAPRATGTSRFVWAPRTPLSIQGTLALEALRLGALGDAPLQLDNTFRLNGSTLRVDTKTHALKSDIESRAVLDLARRSIQIDGTAQPPGGEPWWIQGTVRPSTSEPSPVLQVGLASESGDLVTLQGTPSDLAVSAGIDVTTLAPWVPGADGLSGELHADLVLDQQWTGTVLATDLTRGFGLDGLDAQLTLDGPELFGVVTRGDLPLAQITGDIPPHPAELDQQPLDLVVRVPQVSILDVPELGTPPGFDARVSAALSITGPVRSPDITGLMEVEVASESGTFRITRDDVGLQASGHLRTQTDRGARVVAQVDGTLPVALDDALDAILGDGTFPSPLVRPPTGQAVVDRLPLSEALALAGVPVVAEGTVSGVASLNDGIPAVWMAIADGHLGEADLTEARASWVDDQLDLHARFVAPDPEARWKRTKKEVPIEGSVGIRGRVPLHVTLSTDALITLDEPVDLDITSMDGGPAQLPVALLTVAHPTLMDGAGILALEGHVGLEPVGRLVRPSLDARATLEDGALTVRVLGLRAIDVGLQAAIRDNELTLERLQAGTRPARRTLDSRASRDAISASGSARVGFDGVTDIDATVSLDNALVLGRREQTAWLSTPEPLRLTGALTPEDAGSGPFQLASGTLSTRGTLHVDRSEIALDKPTLMQADLWDGPPRRLDSRYVSKFDPARTAELRPGMWGPLDLDVHVDLGSACRGSLDLAYFEQLGGLGTRASTITMEATLQGDVHLTSGPDGLPDIDGQLDVYRGSARVAKSFFDIEEGTVMFVDRDPFQPFVDVDASMQLEGGGEVDLDLLGTPYAARVTFSSPQLLQPDQLLAAAITGDSPTATSGTEAAVELATWLALDTVLGDATLGTLEIRDGMVRYPVPIGPRIRLTPAVGFGTAFANDVLSLSAAYIATPHLQLESTVGNATQRLDAVWMRRF